LDVHKKTISVAMVEAAAGVRFYGTIAHTPDIIRALCRKLTRDGQQLHFCYESGTLRLRRASAADAARAPVRAVAPALIPLKVGDRVKTDRRTR
jgi:transposase